MVVNFSCSRLFVRRKNREYFETYFLEDGVNILITETIYDGCKHNRLCFAINGERLLGIMEVIMMTGQMYFVLK